MQGFFGTLSGRLFPCTLPLGIFPSARLRGVFTVRSFAGLLSCAFHRKNFLRELIRLWLFCGANCRWASNRAVLCEVSFRAFFSRGLLQRALSEALLPCAVLQVFFPSPFRGILLRELFCRDYSCALFCTDCSVCSFTGAFPSNFLQAFSVHSLTGAFPCSFSRRLFFVVFTFVESPCVLPFAMSFCLRLFGRIFFVRSFNCASSMRSFVEGLVRGLHHRGFYMLSFASTFFPAAHFRRFSFRALFREFYFRALFLRGFLPFAPFEGLFHAPSPWENLSSWPPSQGLSPCTLPQSFPVTTFSWVFSVCPFPRSCTVFQFARGFLRALSRMASAVRSLAVSFSVRFFVGSFSVHFLAGVFPECSPQGLFPYSP